jgi:ubiquitin C-terminal hydrolase
MTKYIKDKFRNVTPISFKAYDNALIINFSGVETEQDIEDFCEFVFNKIHMRSNFGQNPPTVH